MFINHDNFTVTHILLLPGKHVQNKEKSPYCTEIKHTFY